MECIYGPLAKELPKNFTPPEMWPEYGHIVDPAPICKREAISGDPMGIRWSLWPLTFEEYVGDTVPDVVRASAGTLAYNRLAVWYRVRNSGSVAPTGWRQWSQQTYRIDGYQLLSAHEDITARWNKNARRELRLWQERHRGTTHAVVELSWKKYDEAYKKSLISKRQGNDRLHALERRLKLPEVAAHTTLWGVVDRHSGAVVAGSAIIYSPTYQSSTHFAPFILKEARPIFAATALIHHWFAESLRRGMPNIITTNFWHRGKPKSWKGFSEFKSHFGFTYVKYPPTLYRFVRGKFF